MQSIRGIRRSRRFESVARLAFSSSRVFGDGIKVKVFVWVFFSLEVVCTVTLLLRSKAWTQMKMSEIEIMPTGNFDSSSVMWSISVSLARYYSRRVSSRALVGSCIFLVELLSLEQNVPSKWPKIGTKAVLLRSSGRIQAPAVSHRAWTVVTARIIYSRGTIL